MSKTSNRYLIADVIAISQRKPTICIWVSYSRDRRRVIATEKEPRCTLRLSVGPYAEDVSIWTVSREVETAAKSVRTWASENMLGGEKSDMDDYAGPPIAGFARC